MTGVRDHIIQRLWRGRDPFADFPSHLYQLDTQSWNQNHAYLAEAISPADHFLVVEIGVWKGSSTIEMASSMRDQGINGVVVAVDTWLGAADHWLNPAWFDHLSWDHGYPSLHRKFMANIVAAGLQDYVVPLPLDSINAAEVLKHYGLRPSVVHIDAGHEYDSVVADIGAWWTLLQDGGLLIGDDYHPSTYWPGVKRAFDDFFDTQSMTPLEHVAGKCRVRKPA